MSSIMEHQVQVRELIHAAEVNGFNGHAHDRHAVTPALIEAMKREVDRQIRIDAGQALKLADVTYELSTLLEDPFTRALGLRARAQALHVLGRYEESIGLYDSACTIYRTQGRPVDAARIGRSMVDALMYLGRYEEALQIADDARATLAAYGERILAAQLETNVGNVYHRLDQYRQALACYEGASDVFEAAGERTALAVIAFNRANIYSNLDEFRQSQTLYEQAYAIYRELNLSLAAAQVKYSLGYLHFLKGEYHQAMQLLHEVSDEFSQLGDQRLCALCDLDMAELYLQLNVLDEAAFLGGQARARFQKLGMTYEAAKALTYVGLAALRQLRLSEAEEALTTAREEFSAEGNQVYLGLVNIYLAELAMKRGQPGNGLARALEAERLFAGHRLKAKTCYAQIVAARALLLAGQWEEAKEKSEASIASTRELELPWLKQQAHELLGDILQAAGETVPAYDQYVRAVAVIEQIRSGIRVDEFRSAFFKDKLRVYEKLIGICLAESGPEKDAEAFYYLESQKARTLVDLLLNELELVPVNDKSVESDWQNRWQQLRQELHWFYSKVHQQEVSEKSQPNGDLNLLEEIRVRERALVEVARLVQMQSPGFFWLRNVSGMLVEEVRGALAEDETVIEYYFDGEHLKIFVVDHDQLEVVHTPFLRKELKELVLELKFQFEKFHYSQNYLEAHRESLLYSANAVLKDLHEALFEPVADLVEGRKLIFVPFDFLHNVPFQALFDGETYIIDRHEVACAPSARLFALCSRKPTRRLDRALIIGAADTVAPQITQEIDAICNLFEDSECFTGAEVDEKVLAEHSADCDVLHIASHAVFRQDNPMFSAFKLADTWFNFYDVCSLRLPAALVVLSGCSTGANKVYAGDEILGLVRGFLTAGAASMVVSLWAVNDPATAKLMTVFYEQLKSGLAPRKALREAALQTRHSYSHPYYWAPFILIGRS